MDVSPMDNVDSSPVNERSEAGSHGGTKSQTRDDRLKLMRERQELERERKLAQFSAAQEKEEKIRQRREMELQRKAHEQKSQYEQHRIAVEERRKAMELTEQMRRESLKAKMRESEDKSAERKTDKPIYAFGSSTPRQLAYLDKLDTTNRLYNSRLKSAVGEPNAATETEGRTASACSFSRRALVSSSSDVNSPVHRAKSSSVSTRRPLPNAMTASVMVKPSRLHPTAKDPLTNATSMTASFAAGENFAVPQVRNVRRKAPAAASSPARKPPVAKAEAAKKPSPSVHSISEEADETTPKAERAGPKPPKSHERTSTAERKPAAHPIASGTSAAGAAGPLGTGGAESSKKKLPGRPAESAAPKSITKPPRTASAASTDRKPVAPHADKPIKVGAKSAQLPTAAAAAPDIIPKTNETEVVRTPSPKTVEMEPKASETSAGGVDQHHSDSERAPTPEDGGALGQSTRKNLLTTEEDAKAALAERRRLAREEMERQKEADRLREEQIQREEEERIQREEEEFRRQEVELLRQAEERRIADEHRLQKAIEEADRQKLEEVKRAEEDRQRKLEEEVKAKEQAERLDKERQEREEKLRKEEEERNERKKRLDAIVNRTRKSMPGGNGNGGGMDLSLTASMMADTISPKLQSPEEETVQTNGVNVNGLGKTDDTRKVDARMSIASNATYTTAYSPSSDVSGSETTEMSFNTINGSFGDGTASDRGSSNHSMVEQQLKLDKMADLSLMDTTGDVNANESFSSITPIVGQESTFFNESFSSPTGTTYHERLSTTGLPSTTVATGNLIIAAPSHPATTNGVDSLLPQLDTPSDSRQIEESPKTGVKPFVDNQTLLMNVVSSADTPASATNNNDISNGNHQAVDRESVKNFVESVVGSPNAPHVNASLLITSAQNIASAAATSPVAVQLSRDADNNY